jgi:outer membrane receptor protein involved in Fe transport
LLLAAVRSLIAAEAPRMVFDLPSGDARPMLRQFASQARREIVFVVGSVDGVKTNAVRGEMTAQEAVERMLAGTELTATSDPRTGAFAIKRSALPKAPRTAPLAASDRPQNPATPAADGAVMLSPFEVTEESDKSYGALNSNSITRFKVELDKMPVSADILNEAFMADVGAWGVEDMLREYSAGAGTFDGAGASTGVNNPLDRFDTNMSLRGMGAPTVQRDAFMPAKAAATSMGFTSNFDIERVEVINGPQSLLYGFSGAGGAINLVPKQARFGRDTRGSLRFQVNHDGYKQGSLDVSAAQKKLALRFVATRQELGNRRAFIDGKLDGLYGQVAWRPNATTTVRFSESYTDFRRLYQNFASFTALSTANDARNGLNLRYLLATNQIQAAANGQPSGAGPLANGHLNWDNVDSTAGRAHSDFSRAHTHGVTVDSVWSSRFSTQLALGYADNVARRFSNNAAQFLAPNVVANPTGTWAVAPNPVTVVGHTRASAVRLSGVLTNSLWGGRAQSQTALGADFTGNVFNRMTRAYVLADANGNPVVNPSPTAANNGLTILARTYTAIPNGPIRDTQTFAPGAKYITIDGVRYVDAGTNEPVASLVSASNPLGLTGRGANNRNNNDTEIKGLYAANFTTWLEGKLSTLAGLRLGKVRAIREDSVAGSAASVRNIADSDAVSFNAGANFALRDWARPYVSFSDSLTPSAAVRTDPYGEPQGNSRGTGGELGIKFTNESKTISGSVAYFMTKSSREGTDIVGTLTGLINPDGLNGEYRSPGSSITVARRSQGVQVAATAMVRDRWRVRLSASNFNSVVETDKSYRQLYNDQFYTSGQQVTYRDGTPVYVSPTATQVVSATTAGATPLTLTMLNTPGNRYYANPAAESARINPSSGAATVLRTVDPIHGPVLTGATGLPISALQIAPLADSPPPGVVVVSKAGDLAAGNPK